MGWMRALLLALLLLLCCWSGCCGCSGTGILQLTHRYAQREGSSKYNGHKGMSRAHFQLLRNHDAARRGRLLADGVDFPLGGTADPNSGGGLYFTEVSIGTPMRKYVVQVDTGSDVLWVNCRPCNGCPRRSELKIPLTLYDPSLSSSMSTVPCSDSLCVLGNAANEAECDTNTCSYNFQYGDGSTTSGYYIRDIMQFNLVSGTNSMTNATSRILFGCSTNQSGDLTSSAQAVDGIMGFGQLALSVPNQLASAEKIPRVFSHCLEGESQGGGILAIGQVSEQGISYAPLVPNSTHYNVNLLSIDVDTTKLPIDSEQFSSADQNGVIFDSGTTLAYFPNTAFNTISTAIQRATSAFALPYQQGIGQCFLVQGSVSSSFPKITLHFEGGSSMVLYPENYLIYAGRQIISTGGKLPAWCIGWQPSGSANGPKDDTRLTILGDIVLKDKLIIYDLENSRLGWKDFNCSDKVKLAGQDIAATHIGSSAPPQSSGVVTATAVLCILLYILFL